MIWIDFFLQAFVHALAWCCAVAITGGTVWAVVWHRIEARERRRIQSARAWLASFNSGAGR